MLAGVLTLEDGARLIAARGRLMQALPAGGGDGGAAGARRRRCAALLAPPSRARARAALNSPTAMTVAGPVAAIDRLLADPALSGGVAGQKLAVSHAFHSRLLEPMLDELAAAADQVAHGAAAGAGGRQSDGAVVARHDGAYWRAHARQPVRFAAGLQTPGPDGLHAPGRAGAAADPERVRAQCASGDGGAAQPDPAAAERAAGSGVDHADGSGGAAVARRCAVDGLALNAPFPATPTDAPTYPFQRQRYWLADPTLEPAREERDRAGRAGGLGSRRQEGHRLLR